MHVGLPNTFDDTDIFTARELLGKAGYFGASADVTVADGFAPGDAARNVLAERQGPSLSVCRSWPIHTMIRGMGARLRIRPRLRSPPMRPRPVVSMNRSGALLAFRAVVAG